MNKIVLSDLFLLQQAIYINQKEGKVGQIKNSYNKMIKPDQEQNNRMG